MDSPLLLGMLLTRTGLPKTLQYLFVCPRIARELSVDTIGQIGLDHGAGTWRSLFVQASCVPGSPYVWLHYQLLAPLSTYMIVLVDMRVYK